MRVLGVDLGLKRTGLAVCDELRMTTRALPNLTPRSRAQDVQFLVEQCRALDVRDVVIGHPVMMQSADEGPMAKRARGFAEALQAGLTAAGLPVRVHLVDERGSSKRALERLVESGTKRGDRKAFLDGEAARVLIEEFIAQATTQAHMHGTGKP